MTIHELFEAHYADQKGIDPVEVALFRMANGSYSRAYISTDYRYFKAGFEANQGEKMRLIGYMEKEEAILMAALQSVECGEEPCDDTHVKIYVKHCDSHNVGGE